MNHIHLKQVVSTQLELKKLYSEDQVDFPTLISCDEQTGGIGRAQNLWHESKQALSFSCLIKGSSPITLTSLRIGAQLAKYFINEEVKLKWPNDLYINDKKVGGILIHSINKDHVIVGIGLNLYQETPIKYPNYYSNGIFVSPLEQSSEELSIKIYDYLIENHINDSKIIAEWNKYCCHLNKSVKVLMNSQKIQMTFTGLSSYGEAIFRTEDNQIEKMSSATIII